ncbi:MAG: site-specific integrase [Candidatus Nitrosotenuis sp.]|nr:MAG: site-specific integrase [Candidatus Nitrosotenuis sp.]
MIDPFLSDNSNDLVNCTHQEKLNTESSVYLSDEVPTKEGTDMGKNTTYTLTNNTAKKQKTSKKERLLRNPDVKRWYDNTARSSVNTAETRLRKLGNFCEIYSMTPMELIHLGMKDVRTISDMLQDHITRMEEDGKAPQYIKAVMTCVKSWLRHFDVEVKRKMKIANADSTPTLENERVPDGAEMSEILNRADLRTGTAISLIAKAGLRPEVLGNYNGTDGLTMRDLPDIVIQQGTARCLRTPTRIVVRKTLSKTKHQYFTLLTNSGTKKLLAYLNDRLARGEALGSDSPVIAPDSIYRTYRGRNSGKKFLPTARILDRIRKTMRPRFQWRPYVFRAFFDTQLLIAESRGRVARDFRVFWMGHKGGIEGKYTTNKGLLPEALINEMNDAFKRCEEFLDLELREEDPLLKQKEQLRNEIEKATPERVQEILSLLGVCNS